MPVIDDSKLFGLVPIGDRMRISGSAEITGYDATPRCARAEAIVANAASPSRAGAASRYRARRASGPGCGRSARPARRSSARRAIKGLWVNAGHGHLGWTLSCGSGRLLADLVCGRRPGIAPMPGQSVVTQAGSPSPP